MIVLQLSLLQLNNTKNNKAYKKKIFYVISLFMLSSLSYAQLFDSLNTALHGSKAIDFRFESRNSFINHDRIEVQSLKIGVTFGKRITFGGGYSWLKTPLYDKYTYTDTELHKDTVLNQRIRLNYICYYMDYIFYKSKRWQYSIPTQFGTGYMKFNWNYKDINFQSKSFFFLYETGVTVKYKFFTWLGAGANVGYRFIVKNNKRITNKFNSPIYSIGVIIYWNQLALAVFPKNKLANKWLGPVEW